ncbi:T9SS type A sorting domain-containing protein [bacterium]|nr:T9SS type A sorting domain-containing protein [bacterium]
MKRHVQILSSVFFFSLGFLACLSIQAQPVILDETDVLIYPRAAYPPVIDGVLDPIWHNVPRYPMAHYAKDYPSAPGGWYDLSGEWRAMWDDDRMYYFVEVRDDVLNAGPDWNWDSIEFYSDGDASQGQDYDGIDDFQFRIHYDDDARGVTVWTNDKGPAVDPSNFEWDQKETTYGWTAEIAVPMDDLFMDPDPGMTVGTDMEVNDNDEGSQCDHKLIAFGDVELSWSNPSYMGEARLSGWLASDTLGIMQVKAPPAIDGEFEDLWDEVPVIPASHYMDFDYIDDFFDLSMTSRLAWDADYLYAFVRVWDEILIRDGTGDYQDDGIELYFDGDFSHGAVYDGVNDMQIAFRYQDGPEPLAAAEQTGSISGFDLSGVRQASRKTEDGVQLEAAFPMSLLQIPPSPGSILGIEMDYNDDDDGNARDSKLKTYSESDDTWQNPGLMWPARLIGTGTVAVMKEAANGPSGFLLLQNFPNPFNPETTLSYMLNGSGPVRVTVTSLNGRKISTLVNGFQPAGRHEVRFDGSDLPGGLYLCRLQTENGNATAKMMLMK